MTDAKHAQLANRRSRRSAIVGCVAGALVLVVGMAWWLGFLTPEPEAVSLAATVQTVDEQSTEESETAEDREEVAAADTTEVLSDEASASDDQQAITSEANTITGLWAVVEQDGTFAGYRADSKTGEAVGRTPGVTGSLEATDDQISAVNITVDMTTLTSDSSLRDEHLGDEGIEYNTFPISTFVLSEPIQLDGVPDGGASATFDAVGELTVRDVTLPVVVVLEGALVGEQLVVVGSAEIDLDDYGAAVSGTTEAVMEFSLVFMKTTQ